VSPMGRRLLAAAMALSVVHHGDHVLRGATGWPLEAGVNPFTYSLLVYPVIALGLVLTRRGYAGPGSWAWLAGGGALFVLVIHTGPVASDSVSRIAEQYSEPAVGAGAVALLAALVVVLALTCAYEAGRPRPQPPTPKTAPVGSRSSETATS